MATDWKDEVDGAYDDLLDEGIMFQFSRRAADIYDPITGEYAPGADVKFQAPGIVKAAGASKGGMAYQWHLAGVIQAGDEILLVSAATYQPQLGDYVFLNGREWSVQGVSILQPATVAVISYVLIREV